VDKINTLNQSRLFAGFFFEKKSRSKERLDIILREFLIVV